MIDHGLAMKDVRRDILRWPGNRSIHESYAPDLFEPTTLSQVAQWLSDRPRALELIALAATANWSRDLADELVDLVDDWRWANNIPISDEAAEAHADEVARQRGKEGQEVRRRKEAKSGLLPVLQALVLFAEGQRREGQDTAPCDLAEAINRLDVRTANVPRVKQERLREYDVSGVTSSSAGKAQRALRAKGY